MIFDEDLQKIIIIVSEKLNSMLKINVSLECNNEFGNEFISGYNDGKKIIINEKWLKKATVPEMIALIAHEAFHLFQKKVIDEKSLPIYEKWKYEFDNYIKPNKCNFEQYWNQSIEKTATIFSDIFLEKSLNQHINIKEAFKPEDVDFVLKILEQI